MRTRFSWETLQRPSGKKNVMKLSIRMLFVLCILTLSVLLPPTTSRGVLHAQPLALTQTDSGSTIYLKQHQKFTVSLPGNRTTGYNWEVVSAPGLSQQGEPEFVADSNATGAGGTFRYSFITASEGTGGLKMVYRRPWETGTAPLTTFEITAIIN